MAQRKRRRALESEADDDIWEYVELEPEHASVEQVEEDDDYSPSSRRRHRHRQPARPLKTYSRRDSGNQEAEVKARRLGRRAPVQAEGDGGDDDEEYHPNAVDEAVERIDDHQLLEEEDQGRVRTEMVTVQQIGEAMEVNIKYLNALAGTASYYRNRGGDDAYVRSIEADMKHTLDVMKGLLPVTQASPIERAVPPTIAVADGSEMRFTNVAATLGIKWSHVSKEDKEKVLPPERLSLVVEHLY